MKIARLATFGTAALVAALLTTTAPMSTASAAQGSDTVVKTQQGDMIQMAGGHSGKGTVADPKKAKKKGKGKKKKEG